MNFGPPRFDALNKSIGSFVARIHLRIRSNRTGAAALGARGRTYHAGTVTDRAVNGVGHICLQQDYSLARLMQGPEVHNGNGAAP